MTPHEKDYLLAELCSGADALTEAVKGLTEVDALIRLAPDQWSAIECVEHVAVSEEYLFARILEAKLDQTTAMNRDREALIMKVGLDRTRRIPSPEVGKPKGRFGTLVEAVNGFLGARKATVAFVQNCHDDLRSKFTTHPLVPGRVNCWEILLMIAVHPRRHAQQIREIAIPR